MQFFDINLMPGQAEFISLILVSGLIMLIAMLWVIRIRKHADARMLKTTLGKHAEAVERDVVLSDGVEGFLFADYLLLMPGKIVAMKTMSEKGVIFGAGDIDEWTCVENNRTGKFRNPLIEVRAFAHQVKHVLGFDAVEAWVLFDRQSEFPKGVPEDVLQLGILDEELKARYGSAEVQVEARRLWDQLIDTVHADKKRLEAELR